MELAEVEAEQGLTHGEGGSNTRTTSSNPFRNALNKFAKKKEKAGFGSSTTSGTTSFFSRGNKTSTNNNKNQPLPGTVKQFCAGQLPPVWVQPVPAPTKKIASPHAPRSPTEAREETVGQAMDQLHIDTFLNDTCTGSSNSNSSNSNGGANDGNSNENSNTSDSTPKNTSRNATGNHRCDQFQQLLKHESVDLDRLRELSWGGVPTQFRPNAWKLLLGYMPTKQDRREPMLQRKRQEYIDLLQQYYFIADTDRGAKEQATLRQILVDIPRTNPDIKLFQHEKLQQCMERVLYIWAIRHPASGYVQGINDLLTPFLVVFLSAFVEDPSNCDLNLIPDDQIQKVEADSYWCLTKLLDGIQDHYTFAQPGLQRMVQRMEELVHRCDADLFKHIVEKEGVQFVQFAFRWVNCLLMREVPLNAIIRLWDTYLCEDNGFESFHVYVCAAILMTFGEKLKSMEFQDLVLFLQSLPTKDWSEEEIDPLLSRAFILQTYFADAPSHLT